MNQKPLNREKLAEAVVQKMYDGDSFSRWLEIKRLKVLPGSCVLSLIVRSEMVNGFGMAHGSITYALADSALAFASNSHGKKCLSIDTQISHIRPCKTGDIIMATAIEISRSRSLGRYEVEVRNQDNDMVAHFRGTVFVKDENWFES